MKLKVIVACCCLLFAINASAQLEDLLKSLQGSRSNSEASSKDDKGKGEVLGSLFQHLIGTAKVENSSLKGEWFYENPAVVFESSNLLKKAGGSLITNTTEKTLQNYLTKIGFVPGKVQLTFDGETDFTMMIGTRKVTGNYTVNNNEITFTRRGLINRPVTANLAVKLSEMQITFKADKLLDFLTHISSMTSNSTLKMIGNVAGGYDGMQIGFQFKQK